MKKLTQILNEQNNNQKIIVKKIQDYLIKSYNELNWKSMIDQQSIGECQVFVNWIKDLKLPNVHGFFGNIIILESEDYFKKVMTHHWITINNEIYEFSKGTLKEYVNWNNLYDVEDEGEIKYKIIKKNY